MKLLLILLCKGSGALVVPFQRAGGSVPVMHSVPASLVAEIGRLIHSSIMLHTCTLSTDQ